MRYFVLNTDKRYVLGAEEDMIKNKKAAAYADRADQIKRLKDNDNNIVRVFLYSNENGIIKRGIVKGEVMDERFTDNKGVTRFEHNISLNNFEDVSHNPLTKDELKVITGIWFSRTLIEIHDKKVGEEVWKEFSARIK